MYFKQEMRSRNILFPWAPMSLAVKLTDSHLLRTSDRTHREKTFEPR